MEVFKDMLFFKEIWDKLLEDESVELQNAQKPSLV